MTEFADDSNQRKDDILKPKKSGAIKTFALAGLVLLSAGITKVVQTVKKEKAKTEWYDMNKDADSTFVDVEKGEFFAEKRADKKAIQKLEKEKAEYMKQKKDILDVANKEFSEALAKFDVDGMRRAVEAGANNINTPNKNGQTPAMQLAQNINSAKAYQCLRYLVSINVDTGAKDKDGATLMDYLSTVNTLKSATVQREINEKWEGAEVNRGGNSDKLQEINNKLEDIDNKISDAYGHKMKMNKDGWHYSSLNTAYSGDKHYIEGVGGEPTELDKVKMAKLDDFYNKR